MSSNLDLNNTFIGVLPKDFVMIDNYVYLYHTKTLIIIPTYPESIADTMTATFTPTSILSRSAPIFSYSNSGPRSFNLCLHLHRDMMNQINTNASLLKRTDLQDADYVDILIKELQAVVMPAYAASEKMVNPPLVAVKIGADFFCKGVVNGSITTTYSGPILTTDKYAEVTIDFPIQEVDPYEAATVMKQGSFRGLSTDLERRIYK